MLTPKSVEAITQMQKDEDVHRSLNIVGSNVKSKFNRINLDKLYYSQPDNVYTVNYFYTFKGALYS